MSELSLGPQAKRANRLNLSPTQKELLAGTVGGVAQVLVGQPFDLVKVLQQTSPSGTYKGPLDVAVKVFKNEGPRAFYKGTLTPLLGIGACVSIQFAAFGAAKRYFTKDKAPGQNLSMGELFAAGAFAGVANTILSGPIENIRIKLQGQPKPKVGEQKLYNGPLDVASKLYRAHGIKGIFQGQVPTIWRDGLGSGSYFAAYEATIQYVCKTQNIARDQISPLWAVGSGMIAGYALWFSVYPIDVVKSKIQSGAGVYSGMVDCFSKTWKNQGLKGFTNGLIPTLVRSPFANGATFLFFELTMRALQ